MQKSKLYFLIGITVILSIIYLLSLGYTIYFLYKSNLETAGVLATLMGILFTIVSALWKYILKKFQKNLIEPYLNDEHYVDREFEYRKLLNLIQYDPVRIIYVKGKYGMGKTLFMKMACDRINYLHRNMWKSYAAFYYNNNQAKPLIQALSNKFCGYPDASVMDISNRLSNITFQKINILFIDNIYEINLNECTEFAKAFINCNKSNQVVIAVDSNDDEFDICPEKFGEKEIKLLADSYDIEIAPNVRQELSEFSNGYPVYARYSVEAYTKGIKITDYRNFENYIERLIDSLNDLEKESLTLIICLGQLLQDGVETKVLCGIDNRISHFIIERLITYSLITLSREKVYTDKMISLKCMEFLSKYRNESYHRIYLYYKGLENSSYIALLAALKSNFKYDESLIKELLHRQYTDNSFYLLVDIGELEINGQINPYLREDKECWIYIRYYYLKVLLELGLYDKAREVINKYDNQFNLLNVNSIIDFEYQYLLVDLDHLTNHLKDAVIFSQALLVKALTKEQKIKCQYLYAHCLRHIGKDLNQAFTIFSDLANATDYEDNKIRIRSIYSAASIKMFQYDINYDYEGSFEKIEHIMYSDEKCEVWKPYIIRHKAIYEYKICHNFDKAEKILQEAACLLDVTPLRIKYDIYFELAEIYRLQDNYSNYEKSFTFYLEAKKFAERVHDYNLQSSAQLGIMLLNIKYGHKIDTDILKTIIKKTHAFDLNINYNYAIYIKYAIADETIPQETLFYWEKMQYADLLSFSCNNLKLTVM